MTLTPTFTEALEYARAHHADDVRKGTEIPYLSHLLGVTSIALDHGADEEQAIAALLHDVVEDGGGERALAEIGERFGERAASIVLACSDTTAAVKEDWKLRKDRYLAHLEEAPADVLLVSASDKLHNARAILADLRVHGDALWSRFNRGVEDQLWYYRSLADVFGRRLPGHLADELDRTVREIEVLATSEEGFTEAGLAFPTDDESLDFLDRVAAGRGGEPARDVALRLMDWVGRHHRVDSKITAAPRDPSWDILVTTQTGLLRAFRLWSSEGQIAVEFGGLRDAGTSAQTLDELRARLTAIDGVAIREDAQHWPMVDLTALAGGERLAEFARTIDWLAHELG